MNEPADSLAKRLSSDYPSVRAGAIQDLLLQPQQITTRDLMIALQSESVPRVRRSLERLLEARQRRQNQVESQQSAPSGRKLETRDDVEIEVVRRPPADLAALIRHEISPAIGWIRLAADSEIADFQSSRTDAAIKKLQERLDGLVVLVKFEEGPHFDEVNLMSSIVDSWPDDETGLNIALSEGFEDAQASLDTGLFSILISNAFRNAIQASKGFLGHPEVHLTGQVNANTFWIKITNPFNGNYFSMNEIVNVGSSSKARHQGQGMSLIQMAAERLNLSVTIRGTGGLATFTLSGVLKRG